MPVAVFKGKLIQQWLKPGLGQTLDLNPRRAADADDRANHTLVVSQFENAAILLSPCVKIVVAPETGAVYIAPKIGAMAKFRKSIYSPEWLLLTDWLVERRKQAKLSQRQLAENMGVVHSLVGKVEKGERRLDPVELVLYCKGMGANPCDLMVLLDGQQSEGYISAHPETGVFSKNTQSES